jgi:hypothetical protein
MIACGSPSDVPGDAQPGDDALGDGAAATDGPPVPVAEQLVTYGNGYAFVLSGSDVYYAKLDGASSTTASIYRIPKTGGTPTPFASDDGAIWRMAADATSLYWIRDTKIRGAPLATGTATDVYPHSARVKGIAVDGQDLWFSDYDTTTFSGAVNRVSTSGQGFIKLGEVQSPGALTFDADHVFTVTPVGVSTNSGAVVRIARAGSAGTNLSSSENDPWGVASDADHVYWSNAQGNTIRRVRKDGTGTVETLAMQQSSPREIAIDATHVYWTTYVASGAIRRVAKTGGTVETLAENQLNPISIAVDATHVYWVAYDSFSSQRAGLYRAPLPQ